MEMQVIFTPLSILPLIVVHNSEALLPVIQRKELRWNTNFD